MIEKFPYRFINKTGTILNTQENRYEYWSVVTTEKDNHIYHQQVLINIIPIGDIKSEQDLIFWTIKSSLLGMSLFFDSLNGNIE